MAVEAGIVTTVSYRESATSPGSYTDVTSNLLSFPDANQSPDTLPIADGIDLRVRDRDEFTIRFYDISLWSALNTLMVGRSKLDLKFTMSSGNTYTFNPMRFSVKLLTSQVPDRSELLIGATSAGDDVGGADSGDWTSLGSVVDGSALNINANTINDGLGLPVYVSASIDQSFELMDDAGTTVRTTLATYNRAKCRLAVLNPDGKYLLYSGITLQHVPYNMQFGLDQLVTDSVQIGGAAANVTSLITIPASAPPDYLYGFEINAVGASSVQSDYLTVA